MELYKREKYLSRIRGFYHSTDIIKVLTGVRRAGKSSLMQIVADELVESGIKKENICFINLDKRGFKSIKTAEALDKLISESFASIGIKYLFIDEIQNVKDFEEVINGFREEGDYSIFISGSNSYMLSGELVTKLTGRYVEFEVFTLTFDEYLGMKRFYNYPVDSNLSVELNKYLYEGGFPRTIFFDNIGDKRTYVLDVVREIFEKDVFKRLKVKNRDAFELVKNFIVNNYGSTTSINSISGALAKGGNNIKSTTVSKYIKALLDAKIIYECDRFDMKSKKALRGEKKYYLSDIAFSFLSNPDSRINYGPALENIIFIYAKSIGYTVSVGRIGTLECDFILKDRNLNYSYVQVAYTIMESKNTEDREYRPLEKIRDNYPKYVMTADYLLQKRNGIKHINLLDFIANNLEF